MAIRTNRLEIVKGIITYSSPTLEIRTTGLHRKYLRGAGFCGDLRRGRAALGAQSLILSP